jgi:hypothetical protein
MGQKRMVKHDKLLAELSLSFKNSPEKIGFYFYA